MKPESSTQSVLESAPVAWIPPARQIGWPLAGGGSPSLIEGLLSNLGSGPPKPPKPPASNSQPIEEVPPPLKALRKFYAMLTLTEDTKRDLWLKRGLLPSTCEAFGLKSNPKSNRDLLMNLTLEFPMPVLVEAGLFKIPEAGGEAQPNSCYWGHGRIKKKPKAERQSENDKWVYGWNNPVLIPYFDREGELLALRPHKDNLRGAVMRMFVARPREQKPDSRMTLAVLTEGEFKGMALWQAIGDQAAIACLPGITMSKQLLPDIEEWLEEIQSLARVVVAYDSEEKADPALPGYIADRWKRFDAVVWARFLGRHLAKSSFDARVAMLPKEWRDENGKADWDGALAMLVKRFWLESKAKAKAGETPTAEKVWEWVHARVADEVQKVLGSAAKVEVAYQSGFFDSEDERTIRNNLEKLLYEPKLPAGGDREVGIGRRLSRLAKRMREDSRMTKSQRGFLMALAKKYGEMPGGYYQFKNLSPRVAAEWQGLMAKANDDEDLEMKRVCELVLKGIPEKVTNFTMECHYVLRKADGNAIRLTSLRNVHGEFTRKLWPLDSLHFAQPSKMREWLLNVGGYVWRAGERELNDLQADLTQQVVNKEVIEVPVRGWFEPARLWFFEDVAWGKGREEEYRPDRHGIFWVRRDNLTQGYRLGDRDPEGEVFKQGTPAFGVDKKEADSDLAPRIMELAQKMYDTIGGYEGFLALGMMWACAAAPEIYEKWNAMPGLWIHGEQGQGKSSVARWLIRFFGFPLRQTTGIPLPNSSAPGVAIGAQQYGFLPLWLEEYQPDKIKPEVVEILKEMFGHESGSKKRFGGEEREKRAVPLVTGVATSHDGQVRSRYAHVQVSEKKRIGNHFDWFQEESKRFYEVGRMLFRRRPEYAAAVMEALQVWMEMKSMAGLDVRARLVHGVAYAGFMGMLRLFPEFEWKLDAPQYRKFLMEYCERALSDVHEQVNVNQFWVDLMNAVTAGAFGKTPAELRQYFLWKEELVEAPLKNPNQAGRWKWRRAKLYFKYSAVIIMLEYYKRTRNQVFPFNASDLRSQLKVKAYWVPASRKDSDRRDQDHGMRFGGSTPHRCWCILVELHELGYREVSDKEWEASMYKDGDPTNGLFVSSQEYADPRYGDLYSLGELLREREEPCQQAVAEGIRI